MYNDDPLVAHISGASVPSAGLGGELMGHTNAQVASGQYKYIHQLLQLESCIPLGPEPQVSMRIRSPLQVGKWEVLLRDHPDKQFSRFIVEGIRRGFRVGFCRQQGNLGPHKGNMVNGRNPQLVSEYLSRESSLGRMTVVNQGEQSPVHTSPIGLIPKKGKPGKRRLIVDLSSPEGRSVNDGISKELSSITYPTVDHLAMLVQRVGRGAFLVKADVREAFRNVPIHPDDQWLLGVEWGGVTYIDGALPFGLRSAPKLFSAIADAAQWILSQHGPRNVMHYLDDFVLVEKDFDAALKARRTLEEVFDALRLPLEPEKLEGPSRSLKFLGIIFDTEKLQLRLPEEKRERLKEALAATQGRKVITKRELQSLSGLLQHATKVIRTGRAFLHQLYILQSIGSSPWHRVRLNEKARADLLWWSLVVPRWRGISAVWDVARADPDALVVTDASGSWGCGGYWLPHWIAVKWPPQLRETSIQVKELVPVVIAAALWGKHWRGKLIRFRVDNMAVVEILNSLYSHNSHLMHLIRLLVFFSATYDFWFSASHISGTHNTLADALSRNNSSSFLSQVERVDPSPGLVPEALLVLLALDASWTSAPWRELFNITLRQV